MVPFLVGEITPGQYRTDFCLLFSNVLYFVNFNVNSDNLYIDLLLFFVRLNLKGTSSISTTRTTASRNRGRIMRTTSGRGRGGSVIMGSRPVVPAPYVPEELISQVCSDSL